MAGGEQMEQCPVCGGAGWLSNTRRCHECNGAGAIEKGYSSCVLLPVLLIVYVVLLVTGVVYVLLNRETMFELDALPGTMGLMVGYGAVTIVLLLWIFRVWGEKK